MRPWTNLSILRIKDFTHNFRKIPESFYHLFREKYDHLDFDHEQRGLSVNTQDRKLLGEIIYELQKIDGIFIEDVETIKNA